jgi:hypothetical protein
MARRVGHEQSFSAAPRVKQLAGRVLAEHRIPMPTGYRIERAIRTSAWEGRFRLSDDEAA